MAKRPQSNNRDNTKSRPQRGPRGGMGWLFLFAAGASVLAVFIFVPDLPRQLLGGNATPKQLGDEPIAMQQQDAQVSSRQVEIAGRTLSGDATNLASKPKEPENVPELPVAEPEKIPFADAAKGQTILDKAEAAYAAYQWDEARSLANSMRGLDLQPETLLRANDIIDGTTRLSALFETLGTREELVRNLETHPSLVEITMRGRPTKVIPISDMSTKEPIEVDDPIAYMRDRLATGGEVPVVFESNIASVLKASDVSGVQSAGVDAVIAERRALMENRVSEFEQDAELRRDPMAWYEAAKYAYRNRIDDRVVDMLDRALLLSPDLGKTIREDAAQEWFTKMVMAMEGGNRSAAVGFMRQVQKYPETFIHAQAVAFYEGNMEELRAARERAVAQRRVQQEQARERRLERAKVSGNEEAVTRVKEQIQEETAQQEQIAAAPASGDMAMANSEFDKAMGMYQQAQAMGATPERDALYKKTRKHFQAALAVYAAAVDKGDMSVEARMTKANQLQYACMKYARSF